jgi:hypothetical protein
MAIKKKTTTAPKKRTEGAPRIDPRQELLARVAGNVAVGIVGSPSPATSSASEIAEIAVDIAEQILLKAGIASTDTDDANDV